MSRGYFFSGHTQCISQYSTPIFWSTITVDWLKRRNRLVVY